jgi:hypothetical protein
MVAIANGGGVAGEVSEEMSVVNHCNPSSMAHQHWLY